MKQAIHLVDPIGNQNLRYMRCGYSRKTDIDNYQTTTNPKVLSTTGMKSTLPPFAKRDEERSEPVSSIQP